jgi:outer membrane protein assembly factor BamB
VACARTTWIVASLVLATTTVAGQPPVPADTAQAFPTAPIWTIEVAAAPVAPPVASTDQLFLALKSGVSARRLTDGTEVWTSALEVDGPMAASDTCVVLPVKGELHVLDAATGVVIWTKRPGPLTAPPLLHGEWLVVASGESVTGLRVSDGATMWQRETGAVEQRPAVDGTRVYVPAADGRVIALELATGEPAWEFDVGIKPTEPLVYGDRLFVGAAAKHFCSVHLQTGKEAWCQAVGATVAGRPAADATHVYFVAYDNLLRALDRRNGALRWRKDLRYRPSSGPLLVGASLAAPGPVPRLQVFEAQRGTPTTHLTLTPALAAAPLLIEATADRPARFAAVTGGLANVWTVTLAGPPPPGPPPIPVAPLTVLPGLAIPIGGPPILP